MSRNKNGSGSTEPILLPLQQVTLINTLRFSVFDSSSLHLPEILCDVGVNLFHNDLSDDEVQQGRAKGVQFMVVPGFDLDSSKLSLNLARQQNSFFATAGVHPFNCSTVSNLRSFSDQLRKHILDPYCSAVGECGLDYTEGFPPRDVQMPIFLVQVELAVELRKPLYVHVRNAHEDFISIIRKIECLPKVLVHCFTGTADELQCKSLLLSFILRSYFQLSILRLHEYGVQYQLVRSYIQKNCFRASMPCKFHPSNQVDV